MRDSMLHVAGRLDGHIGGRAVSSAPDDPESGARTIYLVVDRERLPGLFRIFDFPSPDISSPERPKTTVPQQALFLLNSPFVIARAEELAGLLESEDRRPDDAGDRVRRLYRAVYARDPDPEEIALAEDFVRRQEARSRDDEPERLARERAAQWRYGFGEYDRETGRLKSFTPLPHFAGSAWQGAAKYPDETFHYLRIDANGGHAGIDHEHAAVRRWIAPRAGTVRISGELRHGREDCGDGVVAWISSARDGRLGEWNAYRTSVRTPVDGARVDAGDAIDFVVDCLENHQCDEFEWAPAIRYASETEPSSGPGTGGAGTEIDEWDAARDFGGAEAPREMTAWSRLAQVLLQSNEFLFVD
jgi:hypothetical protein